MSSTAMASTRQSHHVESEQEGRNLVLVLEEAVSLCRKLELPIRGVITDGQHSIRNAVANVLPGVPHQLCHFHYLREAAKPISDADRHAKKELKKHVRGVRPIERVLEGRTDEEAEAVRGYCLAVRSALTDDGRPLVPICLAWHLSAAPHHPRPYRD